MEASRFNLHSAIENHIRHIRKMGSIAAQDALELQNHLLDSSEQLVRNGLSEEEAFLIARKRLGNENILDEEFGKVNTTQTNNRIWTYLFLGCNIFVAFYALLTKGSAYLYKQIFEQFGNTTSGNILICAYHLLVLLSTIWVVSKKKSIADFLEQRAEAHPRRLISLSFLPVLALIFIPFNTESQYLNYPVYKFESITEFSFYLLGTGMFMALLTLVFSVRTTGRFNLKALFTQPSILFLLSLSVVIELLAAGTRALPIENIVFSSLIFGSVYFLISFCIGYYNLTKVYSYLLYVSTFGFLMELILGIQADIKRGNTYFTVYFLIALLLGVFFGNRWGTAKGRKIELKAE